MMGVGVPSKVTLNYPGITLLQLVSALQVKSQKRVLANSLPLQMFGIGADKLTANVRHFDPKTAIAVLISSYEPSRKETFRLAREINTALLDLSKLLRRRCFLIEDLELDELFAEFTLLEDRLSALTVSTYEQSVEKPFVLPSPRKIVSLFNKFEKVGMADISNKNRRALRKSK
jgi:hypothetical protein